MKSVRSRAPLRLGLAGGGTDLSPYCDQHTGFVLNATIDRYAYCTIAGSDSSTVTLTAGEQNKSVILDINEYPFSLDGELILLKATYNRMIKSFSNDTPIALALTTFCDAPVGSGLGASSSLVVSMVKGFEEYFSLGLDDYEIARIAYDIERIDCRLQGGKQDQYSATFGGFNFMEFYDNERVVVNPLRIRNWVRCELECSLLLHYTGKSRSSARVISDQIKSFSQENSQSLENMHQNKASALVMKEALLKGDFDAFVEIMRSSWRNKKLTAGSVSTSQIEEYIRKATNAGALCAKVSGAGGGGFIMYFVPIEHRNNVIAAVADNNGKLENCHFTMEGSQCWTVR